MSNNHNLIIEQTKQWIKRVVIDCNFCPFASKPFINKSISYTVIDDLTTKNYKQYIINELEKLSDNEQIETSFIILSKNFDDFYVYLQLVKKANQLLKKEHYEGIFQIASFHPNYCFEGSDETDPSNYTNRSIYPMLHFIREDSIEKAIALYPNSEKIPEHNIQFTESKGLKYMQVLRAKCM